MNNLYYPENYLMVPDDICRETCNGCGSRDGINVPDSLLGVSILEACNVHDFMYDEGKTNDDKQFADEKFLFNMYELIAEADWFLEIQRRVLAKWYYYAVKFFGKKAFWKGKK